MLGKIKDFFALERNVAVVSLTYVVAISAAGLWLDFLPAYFESLGATAILIGGLFSFYMAAKAFFHFLAGHLADFYGRKKIYTISFVIWALGVLAYYIAPEWVFLFPGLLIMAIADGMGQTSDSILISESVNKKKRATGRATTHIIAVAAASIAFPIGGLIMQQMGIKDGVRFALLISFTLFLVTAIIANTMLRETLSKVKKKAKFDLSLVRNIKFFKKLPSEVKSIIFTRGISLFSWSIAETFFVLYALNIIKIQPVEWGLLTAFSVLSFGFFTFIGGKISDKHGRKNVILVAWMAAAFAPLVFVFSPSFVYLALAQIVMGAIGLGMSSIDAYTADYTKKSMRGRSIGTADSVFTLSMVFGPFVGGFLFSFSPQLPFFISSFLSFASVVIGWKLLK